LIWVPPPRLKILPPKQEQRNDYQDDENNKHGDNAGARSATLR
jgi:hypothetical protein